MSGDTEQAWAEQAWAEVARGGRRALTEVGYHDVPDCLPGEAHACGGTAGQHALAYFATLKAIADHQLDHLGAHPGVVADIYLTVKAELEAGGCQGVHHT